jgi:hypothetical protein
MCSKEMIKIINNTREKLLQTLEALIIELVWFLSAMASLGL